MQIQLNTDRKIEGHESLAVHVSAVVKSVLARVSSHVTRVEVHLSDENGQKAGKGDKRCVMEARLEKRQPLAATSHAPSLHQAIDSAANKLLRAIESDLGRQHDHGPRSADSSRP
jgi:ribosome-associated translation inhibitor RaiA